MRVKCCVFTQVWDHSVIPKGALPPYSPTSRAVIGERLTHENTR